MHPQPKKRAQTPRKELKTHPVSTWLWLSKQQGKGSNTTECVFQTPQKELKTNLVSIWLQLNKQQEKRSPGHESGLQYHLAVDYSDHANIIIIIITGGLRHHRHHHHFHHRTILIIVIITTIIIIVITIFVLQLIALITPVGLPAQFEQLAIGNFSASSYLFHFQD